MKTTKPSDAYVGLESNFQISAVRVVELIAISSGIPKDAIMHIPSGAVFAGNSAQRSRQVSKLKKQGWRNGYPDIMVFQPEGLRAMSDREWWGYRKVGLAIELKIYPRKPSDAQLRIHELLRSAGWRVVVCYSLEEVEEEAKRYFGG